MSRAFRRITSGIMLAVLVAAAGVAHYPFAAAQDGGSGLQISPTREELSVVPGDLETITFTLKNVTSGDIVARAFLNDFESDNDTGQPKLLVNQSELLPTSLHRFLDGLADIELKAGESKLVKLNIAVPLDASPGAYFGAVRYAAVPKDVADGDDSRQVALTASVAGLVLLTVPGDIVEGVSFEKLSVEKNEKAGTFFTSAPESITVRLANTGNGFIKPFGMVAVYKGSNEVLKYELNDTDPRGNILPNSSRTFRDRLESVGGFGRYKAVASVSYSDGGDVLTQEKVFWIIPVWMWIIIILLLVAVGVGLYLLRKRLVYGKSGKRK